MININTEELGNKIKKIRTSKKLSIKKLAEKVEVSSSLLSQIERGIANPSLNTLRSIANQLGVPMFSFFEDDSTIETIVVRNDQRVRIINGKASSHEVELGYDLLTPDLKGEIQMCEMYLGPYQHSSNKLGQHNAEEVSVCILGSIELHLESKILLLNKGDSVRITRGTLHKWKNPNNDSCAVIFAMTPPIF